MSSVATMETSNIIENASSSNQQQQQLDPNKVQQMLQACSSGDTNTISNLVEEHYLYARQQDQETGRSPLIVASMTGNVAVVQYLLERGAPWNALDRFGQCAGNYATNHQHWDIVNILVDHGTRAELILGSVMRSNYDERSNNNESSSTKPNYLRQRLSFCNGAILDEERDAVMMKWEKPLMEAHAQILTNNGQPNKRVMNVGFGMGIIDSILQTYQPSLHIIIEAHPDIYAQMFKDGWDKKPNVRICYGKWQDVVPQLIQEGLQLDGIFFDTYAEHFFDMEDFHKLLPRMLSKPNGIYSFFNGLAPDNLFFHGVACQCVKLQLGQVGFETEFLPCEIQVPNNKEWEGIRRKYWHDRDTYYLPKITWKPEFVDRKLQATSDSIPETQAKRLKR